MVIEEFKKLLSQRWIICLLLILCFVNVFLDIKNVDVEKREFEKEKETQIEKMNEYNQYLENISFNAEAISDFSLFSENNDYQIKSVKKIVNAYEKVKNVNPQYGNYVAIEKVTSLGFSDVIVILIVLQCVIVLMNLDRSYGMLMLLKSCRKGRTKLSFGKIGALLLATFLIQVIAFGVRFVTCVLALGCGNLMMPVQSVPAFYESVLPMNILTYLVVFVFLKTLAIFSFGLFIFILSILFINNGILYAVTGITLSVSMITNLRIQWDYAIALLKIMSPVTLINVRSFTSKYYNVNLLGEPFNVLMVEIIVIGIYIVLFTLLAVKLFNTKLLFYIDVTRFKKKAQYKNRKPVGMLVMEYKKLLIKNKGLLLLIILCMIQGALLNGVDTSIEGNEKYYSNYMSELQGEQSGKTEEYIEKEKKYYKEVEWKYKEKQEQFLNGQIGDTALMIAEDQYQLNMMPYDSFKKVLGQRKYLNQLEKNVGIRGWYVNDLGIKYLIYPEKKYPEKISWIFMFLIMIILVVLCMGYEEQTGMKKLSDTTLYGGKKLLKKKIWVCITISLIVFLISNLPFLILIIHSYDFGGVIAPVNSLIELKDWVPIPIWAMLILFYMIKLLLVIAATIVVMVISRKVSGVIKKLAISIVVLVLPLIIMVIL